MLYEKKMMKYARPDVIQIAYASAHTPTAKAMMVPPVVASSDAPKMKQSTAKPSDTSETMVLPIQPKTEEIVSSALGLLSAIQKFHPAGGLGHLGSGCHPTGGAQPGGAGGRPGGGLNLIATSRSRIGGLRAG
ncbi:hypothetical protein [Nocardia seriolae]|uniref:hypothetical protein n=3 Tax=Nocardia seriolae TaxID=37332 RepID=UPI0011609B25|nr:hypothetical protein [Nocardia seriolae]MTJ63499.1 hypothetical protein [Nocardia seriolae]MTJ76238.1 hypothetical protein [Nocardia seriolae]MTJ88702.1 hypothetical protein [Nocardia seriolae]MTK41398.1 hypothetical protein [Nocardia seriolae]MTK49272.1 hypothetical protein [Nocardia seriolae]